MYQTILVPTDGSPLSDRAISAAVEFAKEYGGKVIGLSVAEPYPFSPLSANTFSDERSEFEGRAREIAEGRVAKVSTAASVLGVPCETVVTQSFSPSGDIVAVAKCRACDVIFMASHGRKGINNLLIGSETHKVLADTDIPVMVFR